MAKFSAEEHELDEKDTLNLLKDGLNQHEIAKELGRSVQYINNIKKKLVLNGLISDEEIEKYQLEALDNKVLELLVQNIPLSGIMKEIKIGREKAIESVYRLKISNRIPDGIDLIRNDKREKAVKRKQNKKVFLQCIQNNMTVDEILQELGVTHVTLYKYAKDLISEGKLDQQLWEKIKNNNTKYKSKPKSIKISDISQEVRMEILRLVKLGFTYKYISQCVHLTYEQIVEVLRAFKNAETITQKEIDEARKKRNEMDRKTILYYLKRGYNSREIFEKITGASDKKYVEYQIKILIKTNQISLEEIEQYKKESYRNTVIKRIVLNGLKNGKTYEEICNDDKSDFLSISKLLKIKDELISNGEISEEEIQKARQNRLNEYKTSVDSIVLKMLQEGKTVNEMLEQDESGLLTMDVVRKSKKRLIESGQITPRKIEYYKKRAKIQNECELDKLVLKLVLEGKTHQEILTAYPYIGPGILNECKKRLYESGKINSTVLSEAVKTKNYEEQKNAFLDLYDQEVLDMLKYGFTVKEIKEHFKLSEHIAYRFVRDVMKKNRITHEDLKKYKNDAKNRINRLRSAVINDDNSAAQKDFWKMIEFYVKHGRNIALSDLKVIENIILTNPKMISSDRLKLVIMQHIKRCNFSKAKRFVNNCLNVYESTIYEEPLKEFKQSIEFQEKRMLVLKMHSDGATSSRIAEYLSMSEIDVIHITRMNDFKSERQYVER